MPIGISPRAKPREASGHSIAERGVCNSQMRTDLVSGTSITNLPWPSDEWRVDLHSPGFETDQKAAREDAKRARMLRKRARNLTGKRRRRTLALADLLDPKVTPQTPNTPASARYIRERRIRIIGWICKAVTEDETGTVARFDVIKPRWAVNRKGLRKETAKRLQNEFRADLNRAAERIVSGGASASRGFLIAILHGEHESCSELFQLHWHLVATGDWVAVAEGLKKVKAYRPTGRVKRPVRARWKLQNLAYALSYLLKIYWPGKWAGKVSGKNSFRRGRKHRRIKEPFHSDVLMWLHKQSLNEMIVTMRIRAGRNGFVVKSVCK